MVEDRIEISSGGVVTVQEHPQRLSVVVVMPSGDAVEMSPEEARKVVTAMIRACLAIESSPDYEPCAFSDVPSDRDGSDVAPTANDIIAEIERLKAEPNDARPDTILVGNPTSHKAVAAAAEWNARHPVGTAVRYWFGPREGEPKGEGNTHAAALAFGDEAVVSVYDVVGFVGYFTTACIEAITHG